MPLERPKYEKVESAVMLGGEMRGVSTGSRPIRKFTFLITQVYVSFGRQLGVLHFGLFVWSVVARL